MGALLLSGVGSLAAGERGEAGLEAMREAMAIAAAIQQEASVHTQPLSRLDMTIPFTPKGPQPRCDTMQNTTIGKQ